jgi:hypothetical protein
MIEDSVFVEYSQLGNCSLLGKKKNSPILANSLIQLSLSLLTIRFYLGICQLYG